MTHRVFAIVPMFVLLLAPPASEAQRGLPEALADPAVSSALAAVDARRDQTARWLCRAVPSTTTSPRPDGSRSMRDRSSPPE